MYFLQSLAVILAVFASPGISISNTGRSGISCYTCSSRNNSDINCQDPFNPAMSIYTQSCMVPKQGHIGKFPANFCVKVIGNSFSSGENLVIRTCVTESMDSQCGVFRFQYDTLRGCILTCDFDGCNAAPRVARAALPSILMSLLVLSLLVC